MAIKAVQAGPRLLTGGGSPADLTGVWRPVVNPKDKGAGIRFDNSPHPLSESYASNAAAQAAYPLTTAWLATTGRPAITTADTHDWAAVQEAILACPPDGAIVALPYGKAHLSRGLHVGDGTASSHSTVGGVQLIGQGWGRSGGTNQKATMFRPVAAGFSDPMITVHGPITAIHLADIVLDAVSLAPTGLQTYHPYFCTFTRLHITRCTGWQIRSEQRTDTDLYQNDLGSSRCVWDQIALTTAATGNQSGWWFGDSNAVNYNPDGDANRHVINSLELTGNMDSTGTGLQLGTCDACTFNHVYCYGWQAGKQLRIKPSAGIPQYPDNITIRDAWFGHGAIDDFWVVDESQSVWTPGNSGIIMLNFGQEGGLAFDAGPPFPADSRIRGYSSRGQTYNWPGFSSGDVVFTHYDLIAGANAIAAPTGSPTQQIISIKQNAGASGTVTWDTVYKHVENFGADLRANRRSIYTFTKHGTDYRLSAVPVVGVL